MPADIQTSILSDCEDLKIFADEGRVDRICSAIGRAMEVGDPGLIDLVLENLAALEP